MIRRFRVVAFRPIDDGNMYSRFAAPHLSGDSIRYCAAVIDNVIEAADSRPVVPNILRADETRPTAVGKLIVRLLKPVNSVVSATGNFRKTFPHFLDVFVAVFGLH